MPWSGSHTMRRAGGVGPAISNSRAGNGSSPQNQALLGHAAGLAQRVAKVNAGSNAAFTTNGLRVGSGPSTRRNRARAESR